MITLANQKDDNWPISKYQETPAANQPLPTPCLCSKLINTAVNLGSGLLFYSTVLDVTRALARASNKPLYASALLMDVLFSQFWGLGYWATQEEHIKISQQARFQGERV